MDTSSDNREKEPTSAGKQFAALADRPAPTLAGELIQFLRHSKKWWLTPILVVLALVGLLVGLGGTAAAPWIYTLF